MLEEGLHVKRGQEIKVQVTCVGSYLSFKIVSRAGGEGKKEEEED
jgi:hypothetical protein